MIVHQFQTILFLVFALPAALIDLKTLRIPDALTFSGFFALLVFIGITRGTYLPEALAAAAFYFAVFLIIRVATKGLGMGDVKFAALVGLYCGIRLSFVAFLLASLAGIVAAGLLYLRFKDWKRPIPFAPFLVMGAVGARFLNAAITLF